MKRQPLAPSSLSAGSAEALRSLREVIAIDQETLAERADLDAAVVAKIEEGDYIPSLIEINQLAAGLGLLTYYLVATIELFGGQDELKAC